jgi:cell division protein FtsZ
MKQAGSALMGIGRAGGEDRAKEAAKAAIDSPLLELSINGATGVLFTISGNSNLTMYEVSEAAEVITAHCDPEAKIIFGATIDESLGDDVKLTVIATGFKKGVESKVEPVRQSAATFDDAFTKINEDRQVKRAFEKKPEREDEDLELAPKTKEEEELDIPAFLRKKIRDR